MRHQIGFWKVDLFRRQANKHTADKIINGESVIWRKSCNFARETARSQTANNAFIELSYSNYWTKAWDAFQRVDREACRMRRLPASKTGRCLLLRQLEQLTSLSCCEVTVGADFATSGWSWEAELHASSFCSRPCGRVLLVPYAMRIIPSMCLVFFSFDSNRLSITDESVFLPSCCWRFCWPHDLVTSWCLLLIAPSRL